MVLTIEDTLKKGADMRPVVKTIGKSVIKTLATSTNLAASQARFIASRKIRPAPYSDSWPQQIWKTILDAYTRNWL